MEPWQSWAAAIVIGGAAFLYYSKDSKYFMKARDTRSPSISDLQSQGSSTRRRQDKQTPRQRDEKSQLSYAEVVKSEASSAPAGPSKKRKAGRAPVPPAAISTTSDTSAQTDKVEDDDAAKEDRDWARQLDATKKGVSLESSTSAGQRKTAKKQQRPNGAIQPQASNGLSSTNGTPGASAPTPVGGDVSDMLEPRASGPSVIRVTGEVQEPKRPAASRPEPVQETKKQRQNRKKAEEKKLQREEEEKQRQVLLEKQRRTAREARGEPSKNGLTPSNAPAAGVWWKAPGQSSGQTNGSEPAAAAAPNSNGTVLLDTFDHDALSTSSSTEPHTDAMTPVTAASTYEQDLPSEEVQLAMLDQINQDAGWSEVSAKGKKSKKKASTSTPAPHSPTSSSGKESNALSAIPTNELVNGSAKPAPVSSVKSKPQTNTFAALEQATGYTPDVKGHPDDSDWAVF